MPGVGTIVGDTTRFTKPQLLRGAIEDLNDIAGHAAKAETLVGEILRMDPTQREFNWKLNDVRNELEDVSNNALSGYRALVRYGLENRVRLHSYQLGELERRPPASQPHGKVTVGQLLESAVLDVQHYEGIFEQLGRGTAQADILREDFHKGNWDYFTRGALRDAVQAAQAGAHLLEGELARATN